MKWILSNSDKNEIVLTSRVRLARNIKNLPFPHKLTEEAAQKVVEDISKTILENDISKEQKLKLFKLKNLNPIDRLSQVERHIISMDLLDNFNISAVITDETNNIAVMINEEDHLRIQAIYEGLKIKEAYALANRIDDIIEEKIDYAFDSKLGYLTTCPTNLGTGIRASVMLHLPALTFTKNIDNIFNTVAQVGLTIRGLYGEGSNIMGDIYQISNQVTLGLSEEEILNNLEAVTKKIVDQENMTRKMIFEKQGLELENDLYRALGLLKYSRILSTNECLNLISRVRMGIEMGIVTEKIENKLNNLLVTIQPATMQLILGKELDSKERDIERAKYVREVLIDN